MFNRLLLRALPLFRRVLFRPAFCVELRRYPLPFFFRTPSRCFLRETLGLCLFSTFTRVLLGASLGLCNFQRQPARFFFRTLASFLLLCSFASLFFRTLACFFGALLGVSNFARESICLFGGNPPFHFFLRLYSRCRLSALARNFRFSKFACFLLFGTLAGLLFSSLAGFLCAALDLFDFSR